jgi:hypothetical protein
MSSTRWRKNNRRRINSYQNAWYAERSKDPAYMEARGEYQRRNYRTRAQETSYRKKLSTSVRASNLKLQKQSERYTRAWAPSPWTPFEEILLLCLFPAAARSQQWNILFSTFHRSYFSIRTKYHKIRRLALSSL